MNYIIVTRSRSDELYEMASSFWPADVPRRRLVGYNHYKDALSYLQDIQNEPYDYVVNIDEDCFVYDWAGFEGLLAQMPGHILAGMPDSLDYCSHRNNSEFVFNPFFNVFYPSRIKSVLLASERFHSYAVTGFQVPGCNFHEPFNCFFDALKYEPAIKLKTATLKDQITTDLGFALHTWYSREFEGEHRERILSVYEQANYLRSLQRQG